MSNKNTYSHHPHYTTQKRWTSKNFVVIEYPIEETMLTRAEFVKMVSYHFSMQLNARTFGFLLEDYEARDVYMLVHNFDGKNISVDPKISKYGIPGEYKPWNPYSYTPMNYMYTNDKAAYHPDLLIVPPQNKRFRRRSKSISLLYWRKKLLFEKIPEARSDLRNAFRKFRIFLSSLSNETRQNFSKKNDVLVKKVETLKTLKKEFDELNPAPGKTYYYLLVKVNVSVLNKNYLDELDEKKDNEGKKT